MISNRQNSRRRGRGGSQRSSGGSGQRDSGNRIDSRARGNAAQLLEKYKNMARDAQMQGDRVNTEYYLQFADHYFRVLSDGRSRNEDQRQPAHSNGFDGFDSNADEDYGDEGEPIRADEQAQRRENGNRDDPRRDNRPRDDGRDDSRRREYGQRDDNRRDTQNRDGQNRDYNRDQSREQTQRNYAPHSDGRDDRRAPQSPQANGHAYGGGADLDRADTQPGPERKSSRSRPPMTALEAEATPSFDADRLPPSLGVAAAPESEGKPKRRRGRPPASETAQPS